MKITAARMLWRLGRTAASERVQSLLGEGSGTLRALGANLAGRLGDKDLAPRLAKMVREDEPYVAYRAARALARIGGDMAFKVLLSEWQVTVDTSLRARRSWLRSPGRCTRNWACR